jgi:glycosyltransferase involved in cell wall biosynthesis
MSQTNISVKYCFNMEKTLVSVVLPTMNEIDSLSETVRTVIEENQGYEFEFLIIVSPKSAPEVLANAHDLAKSNTHHKFVVWCQEAPLLGGAISEGFDRASGYKIILMAADLETNPSHVTRLLFASEKDPEYIIVTSRWIEPNSFNGYGSLKKVMNWIFQKAVSRLYGQNLTDWTYGYRLYPKHLIQNKKWKSSDFAFLLESILLPLNEGAKVVEIPTNWKRRAEGISSNSIKYYKTYFKIAWSHRKK